MSNQTIKTPCVGLCSTVYGDLVCRGCKRYHHEVIQWNGYNAEEKQAVWLRLEQLLVQPATRLSAELLNRYLADDFYEIGASGRCFGKADVLERLPTETPPVITQQDFNCRVLANGLAQLTYRATIQREGDDTMAYSMRSSLYRFDGEKWQMVFHQGTACEPF